MFQYKRAARWSVVIGALVLGACGSSGGITAQTVVSQAEQAISLAKSSGADTLAPELLQSAESKIAMARQALAAGELLKALQGGEKALVDAQYAAAKASAQTAAFDLSKLR